MSGGIATLTKPDPASARSCPFCLANSETKFKLGLPSGKGPVGKPNFCICSITFMVLSSGVVPPNNPLKSNNGYGTDNPKFLPNTRTDRKVKVFSSENLDFLKNMKNKNKTIITESLKTSYERREDTDSGTLLDENNIL